MNLVTIDSPSPFEVKGRPKGLSFNAFFRVREEYDKASGMSARGFRIMSGMIYPPSAKLGSTFKPVMQLPEEFAETLYDAIVESGWPVKYTVELLPKEIAISPLLMSRMDAIHLLPNYWEELEIV